MLKPSNNPIKHKNKDDLIKVKTLHHIVHKKEDLYPTYMK